MTQRRPDLYKTILSGDLEQNDIPGALVGTNALAVIKNRANAATIELDGLIVQGGVTGIVFDADGDDVVVRGCVIRGNGPADSDTAMAGSPFGGYSFLGNNVDLVNCVISGNVGRTAGGGSLAALGSYLNCTFNGNRGGVFSCDATGNETTQGCLIWNQRAGFPSGLNSNSNNLAFGDTDGSGDLLDPRFWQEVDWERAPTTEGLLRLGYESDAINSTPLNPLHNGRDAGNGSRNFGSSPDIEAYEWRGVRYVDANATGSQTGVTWANAYTDLQDALGPGATGRSILVAEGTYYPDRGSAVTLGKQSETFTLRDVELLGGFPQGGGLLKSRDLSGTSILSGDLTGDDGGAFSLTRCESFFSSVTLEENTCGGQGGAAFLSLSTGGFFNLDFIDNEAFGSGGAITAFVGALTLEDVNFFGNVAQSDGGAFNHFNATFRAIGCEFKGNLARDDGGALHPHLGNNDLHHCLVTGNRVLENGGGIYDRQGSITYVNTTLYGNRADDDGGAIYCDDSNPSLKNCLVLGNSSNSSTTTSLASIRTSSTPNNATYRHSYLENLDLSGNAFWQSYNGISNALPVNLAEAIDPANAPTQSGTARPRHPSLAINGGAMVHVEYDRDVDGDLRTDQSGDSAFDLVTDLGAFEARLFVPTDGAGILTAQTPRTIPAFTLPSFSQRKASQEGC